MPSGSSVRFVYDLHRGKQRYLGTDQDGVMYVSQSALDCVVFIGVPDDTPGKGGIHPLATGFLLSVDSYPYLITNKHVVHPFKDAPFVIRANTKQGVGKVVFVDGAEWIEHPDPTVDLAAWDFALGGEEDDLQIRVIPSRVIIPPVKVSDPDCDVGLGDLCNMVGLFQFLPGSARNIPVVHTGNLAMVPDDEMILSRDWEDPSLKQTRLLKGYLVEAQSMRGLSGSPVFVRKSLSLNFAGLMSNDPAIITPYRDVHLLGVWQGAWDAAADEVMGLALNLGEQRVPVGMGVVVPGHHIWELLDLPEVKERREKVLAEAGLAQAATPDNTLPKLGGSNGHQNGHA